MSCASFVGLLPRILVASTLTLFAALPVRAQSTEGAELVKRIEEKLARAEKTLGPEHVETLGRVHDLGVLYTRGGRYSEAEPLLERALTGYEKALGPEHPDTLQSVENLAGLYETQGRYAEAEPMYRRVLVDRENTLGPEHLSTLSSVNNLAFLYSKQGRYAEAEPMYRLVLAAEEKALGPEHRSTLISVNNLGFIYLEQGRYGEAEPLYRRALTGREKALGLTHPETLLSVNNLAALYDKQGRYGEAEPLYRRALTGGEKVLGPEHLSTLTSVNNLAYLCGVQGRYGEAEPLYRRALAGHERVLGSEHPYTLESVNNLAALYNKQGRHGEAEPLIKRALAGYETALGSEHPSTLRSVNNLGILYWAQDRYGEAEPLFKRALAGREKILGVEHPETLLSVNNLAGVYFARRDWREANQYWRRSTAAIVRRVQRGALDTGLLGKTRSEIQQNDGQFRGLVKVAYRLAPVTATEMFETAQWVLSSEAAQSLTQMAARGAMGDPALAALVRDRQDLVYEWQAREKTHAAALGQETVKRNTEAEAENSERMTAVDKRIVEIDAVLKVKFPDYAALTGPAPLAMRDVQAQLGADEALVLFLDTPERKPTPEETFIWVVTKTQMRWVRSDLGKGALAREVAALRCGLDDTAWEGPRCKELTGARHARPLPFDHARAYRLYQALFGQVEDLIKDKKHLLLVPSGALTQLPFQVLVTAPPVSGDHRSAAWLVREHALSVLPAVSSLKALRATSHPSAAAQPMIGFGNPLLDGPDDRYMKDAKLAREKQGCPKSPWQQVTEAFGLRNGATPIETRGGLANVSLIRELAPLPETADELCAVARDIGADASEMHLGVRATEREVKAMSARGDLAQYRLVHFATHGAMAGELNGSIEPGLILTPPNEASAEDDGYLSASEVASLKLDADWVILSACNTAAGDAGSAEALSGLARAFIYAQARALLVSHWAVYSDATVKMITTSLGEMSRDETVGRAEALRRAMLALIDKGTPEEAHPAYWAPFVVVGEGGR
jgi:CHAT domain-containing protein/tetratricopeptide (TPR) repeat protein